MGKRSRVMLILALILVFGISGVCSAPITNIKPIEIENLDSLDDVIFVPGSLLQNGKDSFLILFNHNEIRLYEEGLEEYTAKSFDEKIVSTQLLEKNAPNIFLVATSHKIYFLDESLPKKNPLTFVEEIKKVIAIWNDNKVNYDLLIQYNKSVNCYSIDGEEEWEYLLNEEIMLLSTTENDEKIFGNTKNKIFIIDRNGYERTKKEFSEVFSVHPLSDGILIHCFDGEKYTLKRIEFNDPNEIKSLDPFDEPLNVVAVGRQYPNSDTELIYFQEANGTFHVIHKGGSPYIDPFQLDLIKKIIIEDLDGVLYYYDAKEVLEGKRGLKTWGENKNEFILVTKNKIFICAVREELKIVEWEKDLNSFFIPKEQPKKDDEELTTSRMVIYNTCDKICFGNIFDDYLWFWDRIINIKSKIINEEDYNSANAFLENAKDKKDAIEFYKAQDIVQSWESFLNEKIEGSRIIAENYVSQAEKECENGNYITACDMYYSALIEYRKFESRDEIKKRCEILLSCANELYESSAIENYEIKIELFSLFFELFDLHDYVGADAIGEIESINSKLKEDFIKFEEGWKGAFKSAMQEIEADAIRDEEAGDLKSAKDKNSALIEPYRELLEDEQKAQELENKVSELDSEIQRQHVLYVGISFIVLLGIIYLWRYKKREPLQVEMEKEKTEEELTEEQIKAKIEKYEKKYKHAIYFITVIIAILSFASYVNESVISLPMSFIVLICGVFLFIEIWKFIKNYHLKGELEKQTPKREIEEKEEKDSEEKTLRDFFVDPETGEPNFVVIVGNAFEQYMKAVKEFLGIISEEGYFSIAEILPTYRVTKYLGNFKTKEKEQKHFVEVDTDSITIKDNEIISKITAEFNLLLAGFFYENELIKELVDQELSKVDWEFSTGEFELIHDAFAKGKDVVICSGKDKDAISKGLRSLLEKLYEEDSKNNIQKE